LERCVRDIEFPGAGNPDWVDHHDCAEVLKDVRRLEVAVQGDGRTALALFEQRLAERLQGRYVRDGGVDARTPVSESLPAGARGSVKCVKEERQPRGRKPRRSSRTGAFQEQRAWSMCEDADRRMAAPAEHRVRLGRQALLVSAQLQRRLEAALGVTPRHDSPRARGYPLIIK
jgi:hypothetical protein